MPCTNCAAFRVECKVTQRNIIFSVNKNTGGNSASRGPDGALSSEETSSKGKQSAREPPISLYHMSEQSPMPALTVEQAQDESIAANMLTDLLNKTKFTSPALGDPGQVTFLGESASVNWLIRDHNHPLHFPMAPRHGQLSTGAKHVDGLEMNILHQRNAFRLPPKDIRNELVAAFFRWVHPIVPVLNKTQFMAEYDDSSKPQSLFLLQAILLAGSQVCKHPKVSGNIEAQRKLSQTFYERAKALYNAGFETDRIKMIQGLILMSWYSQSPEAVSDNAWFWTSVAISVAEGAGMHRSIEKSNLTRSQKRTWKRIWWTLYTRDREVAITLGRPCIIKLEESDVEPLTVDDFDEGEIKLANDNCRPFIVQVRFFLEFARLCDIITVVLAQQQPVRQHWPRSSAFDLHQSEIALGEWMKDCQLPWLKSEHELWSALLALHYHTTVCLIHRAYLSRSSSSAAASTTEASDLMAGSMISRNMAYRSADAITEIAEVLQAKDELLYCPSFVQYSLLSALTLLGRRVREPESMNFSDVGGQIRTCISTLQDIFEWGPMNDTVRLWLQPVSQPPAPAALAEASSYSKKHKRRSHSFHTLSFQEQQRQQQASGGADRHGVISTRRMSSYQKASCEPNFVGQESAQRLQASFDHSPSVPGVPMEMLSVFGLSQVSQGPLTVEKQRKQQPDLNSLEAAGTGFFTTAPEKPAKPKLPPQFQFDALNRHIASSPVHEPGQNTIPRYPMTWDNQQIYEATRGGGNVLRPGGFEGHRSDTVGFTGTTSNLPGSFTEIAMDDWFRYFGVHEEQT
ncbi:transcriptional regulatory protein AMDR [Microdochium nivale]|nr:transcriptional regulatory protein AMDR [Microdochium nivale]